MIYATDTFAEYRQVWCCPPPLEGVTYRVTRGHWLDNYTSRYIYAIELVEDAA